MKNSRVGFKKQKTHLKSSSAALGAGRDVLFAISRRL